MTDEDRQALRAIGRTQAPFRGSIERAKIVEFAQALRLRDPIHLDVAAAQAAGYRDLVAPAGFLNAFTLQPRADKFHTFGIDEHRALVGEIRWQQYEPICAGDELHGQSVLVDIVPKRGRRPAQAISIETRFHNQFERTVLVFTELTFEFEEPR